MAIVIKLDELLKAKGIKAKALAEAIDITEANLSILNSGKAKAIRFSTLESICKVLGCQPGDIIKFEDR
ncbi:helix-turn-helix transcriptional regulator [Pseudenterobacter timonensis]|uniref:Helix-turn-helix transcriptional regulator n=1 Tax=Pseudenterobacter timonensis TaxID=1755099 RepID=A0AAE4DLV8_9ENTR|nr:helix-turn-helix transcriptional regulator [Pseudenterobacter timonensis]MDR9889942.1 helix-turn-helix transcriptional regulator [Pseudenterobacter timonensis]